jgi:serine/threonine protein kinase
MGVELHLEIDYRAAPLHSGDLYLLTTDGTHAYLTDAELAALLGEHRHDPEQAARAIVTGALERGSHDNVTCQVLRVDGVPFHDNEEAFYRHLTELPFPPPLEPGMVLDGFRILRELHASKRTQIYLALDTETNRRTVLKTPSVSYADDARYIDRFRHEEWAGRRINNAHVLALEAPRRRRRFLYYATEYVEGRDLRQWMHDNPTPSLAEVRDILEQIAQGLRAFHRLEMIHQDLKPENIRIDPHGTVKIIDFGSTRIAGIDEIATPLGLDDDVLGTLNYTAPEYAGDGMGSNRSDLFSLGVIAYEMLTGQLPYGDDLAGWRRRRRRPPYTPAKRYNPEVPAWMDGALRKAVQVNPVDRYGHLSEFIYDLSHPNPKYLKQPLEPLLERNPVGFWRALAILLFILCLLELYLLSS